MPPVALAQLCDGASEVERAALRLKPAKHFHYLNQSNCYDLRGVSNAEEYRLTRRSMNVVGIPEVEQDAVFRTVAAVLHLGNVAFEEASIGGADASSVAGAAEEHLEAAAHLLAVDSEGLRKALTTRTRQTPDGAIVSPIDVKAAQDNRDSLSKTIYSRMFDWLVEKINSSIGQDPSATNLIGVLDIYGAQVQRICMQLSAPRRSGLAGGRVCTSGEACGVDAAPGPQALSSSRRMTSSSSASTWQTRSCSSTSTSTCSRWSRQSTSARPSNGATSSLWTTKMCWISSRHAWASWTCWTKPAAFPRCFAWASRPHSASFVCRARSRCMSPAAAYLDFVVQATHEDFANKLYGAPSVVDSVRFSKPKLSRTDFTIEHYAGAGPA